MTRTKTRDVNPLAKQHFTKVVRRNRKKKEALFPVWGITWNLRGHTMLPLGSASMMVMSSHPSEHNRNGEMIELSCLVAQVDPQQGTIHYSDVRMSHDFSKNPHAGARGRILDPRDEGCSDSKPGDKPNGSWVRLAMELDRNRSRSVDQNWRLPVVPTLPTFWAGFPSMDAINMEITPALVRTIAGHMERPVEHVEAMPQSDVRMLAASHWPDLWKAPNTEGNETQLWLINTDYITKLTRATRLFEDFSGMVGVDCCNPARDVRAAEFTNPVPVCAEALGIDVASILDAIAHTNEGEGDGAAEEAIRNLKDKMREYLGGYSDLFCEEDLENAIATPSEPLTVVLTDPLNQLPEADAIRLARQQLEATRPLFSPGTTDEDLRAALANPAAPLFASKMCQFQVLRRDPRVDPGEAMSFGPETLGRDRVYANLWVSQEWAPKADGGRSRRRKPRRGKKETAHAAAE